MQAINRWRNWKPTDEKFFDSSRHELTKPTKPSSVSFVSPIPRNIPNFSGADGIPAHDSDSGYMAQVELLPDEIRAWDEAFHGWTQAVCVWREHSWRDLGALHVSYCEWADARNADVCDRQTFEAVLTCLGFALKDGMIDGLIFREDAEAATA
ncbi:MAG: hypothetical protein ABI076_06480 [Acidobacteriaceae bacterium]